MSWIELFPSRVQYSCDVGAEPFDTVTFRTVVIVVPKLIVA